MDIPPRAAPVKTPSRGRVHHLASLTETLIATVDIIKRVANLDSIPFLQTAVGFVIPLGRYQVCPLTPKHQQVCQSGHFHQGSRETLSRLMPSDSHVQACIARCLMRCQRALSLHRQQLLPEHGELAAAGCRGR